MHDSNSKQYNIIWIPDYFSGNHNPGKELIILGVIYDHSNNAVAKTNCTSFPLTGSSVFPVYTTSKITMSALIVNIVFRSIPICVGYISCLSELDC